MQKTHWRKYLNTEYLGGFDLDDGKGGFKEITVTIKKAINEIVKEPATGKNKEVLTIHFEENVKPMILNVGNSKTLQKLSGSKYIENWSGLKIIIGTEKVKAFGEVHDALRIRDRLPESNVSAGKCTDCKMNILGAGAVTAEQVKEGTTKTYGVQLCLDCANERKKNAK